MSGYTKTLEWRAINLNIIHFYTTIIFNKLLNLHIAYFEKPPKKRGVYTLSRAVNYVNKIVFRN